MRFLPALLNGLGTTLFVSLISLLICIVPGTILFLGKRSKIIILRLISTVYTEFFEGIPVLAQLFFVYYCLPLVSRSLTLPQVFTAIIVLSLNGAANIASFSKLYLKSEEKTIDVIHILKIISLTIVKVFGELIKYSSLLSIIGMKDLLRVANTATSATSDITAVLIAIFIYLILNFVFKSLIKTLQIVYKMEKSIV